MKSSKYNGNNLKVICSHTSIHQNISQDFLSKENKTTKNLKNLIYQLIVSGNLNFERKKIEYTPLKLILNKMSYKKTEPLSCRVQIKPYPEV